MKLTEWVEELGGAISAARKLRVSPARLRVWLRAEASPQVALMQRIVKTSGGRVSLEEIIKETTRGRA